VFNQKARLGGIVLLAIVVVGLGVGIAIVIWPRAQSAPVIAAIEITSTAPATTSSTGSTAEFYRSVNDVLGVDCPASSNLSYPEYPPFGTEWDRMAKAAWGAEQPALVRVREARAIQKADWPEVGSANWREGTYLNPLRNVANHLGDAALYQHLQGDDAGAVERIKDLQVMCELLEQRPEQRGGFLRTLVAGGVRALASVRILIIASDVQLTSDRADHRGLQLDAARWLIGRLLDQRDARVVANRFKTEALSMGDRGMTGAIETFNRVNVERTFAAMSLACHLFIHDHSRWPNSIDELVPAYLPHESVDPWGDGHQMIGYVLIKGGLPDGADRPMVYSRCGARGKLFYRVDQPEYGFYTDDGTNANRPHHNPSGQFRDVASWVPGAGGGAGATTRELQ
jgi:hypothetical protein